MKKLQRELGTILVVNGEEIVSNFIRQTLEGADYRIRGAQPAGSIGNLASAAGPDQLAVDRGHAA